MLIGILFHVFFLTEKNDEDKDYNSADDEDSDDDAEVKSHSDSGSRLRLDTDHHNIPDAVTYERDKKQKVSMYATFDANAQHQKLRKKSQSELQID